MKLARIVLSLSLALCAVVVLTADADAARRKGGKSKKGVYDYHQPKGGCTKYAWPVTREVELFTQTTPSKFESGATRPKLPEGAFVIDLDADSNATLVMPPERKSRQDNGYGGSVTFNAIPRDGLYQISLSEDGLIDVIQDGKYLRKQQSAGRRDCPSVRRTMRVQLSQGPLVLQFGGVEMPLITVAVSPVEGK